MAFVKKTWKDRVVQYANRRLLTKSSGEIEQVVVTRDEGTVTEAGDKFDAATMNDLEDRLEYAFDNVSTAIECTQAQYDTWKNAGQLKPQTSYIITDAPNLNPTASDIEYSSGVTVKQAIDGKADISTPTPNLTCPRCPISSFESYKIQKIGNVIFFSADLNFGATSETGVAYFSSALVDNADFVQGSLFDDLADTGYQIYKGRGGSLWIRNGSTGLAGSSLVNKTRMMINLIIFKAT